METAKLRIVRDAPPPRIMAQATLEAFLARPLNQKFTGPVPRRIGGRLDVDAVLARSLPKLSESLKKMA